MTAILGLNAHHADAAACLIVDGRVVAAVEEERFTRVKHWAGVPVRAARFCLEWAGLDADRLDVIAVNADRRANRGPKLAALLRWGLDPARLRERLDRRRRLADLPGALGVERRKVAGFEHHDCHLAHAALMLPEARGAVASVDGFGDGLSAKFARAGAAGLTPLGKVGFPHSLGLFYLAFTQYLGFPEHGDEYKVMGLAAHGAPDFLDHCRRVLRVGADGTWRLDLAFFRHQRGGVAMSWDDGAPRVAPVFSAALETLLGPARAPGEPLGERHAAIAASAQAVFEEALTASLTGLRRACGEQVLGLAGGCAMNSLAVGRLARATGFARVVVPAAAGDAGGAMGAAALAYRRLTGAWPCCPADMGLGPGFGEAALDAALGRHGEALGAAGVRQGGALSPEALCKAVAALLDQGAVVGWFQGRAEWGARALGHRSILCDPRRADARDLLNLRIKRREPFRPFAPAVLAERFAEWFEGDGPLPHMTHVVPLRAERRAAVPAVVHADGTGRPQTVSAATDPLFHSLIEAFAARTGVPILLNTSFNENEPIVTTPDEALACFLRTRMDALALGPHLLRRHET